MDGFIVAGLAGAVGLLLLLQQLRVHQYQQHSVSLGLRNERLTRDLKLESSEIEGVLGNVLWAVVILDARGDRALYANAAAISLFGVTDTDALNRLWFGDTGLWPGGVKSRNRFCQWLAQVSWGDSARGQWQLPMEDGRMALVDLSASRTRFRQQSALLLAAMDIAPFIAAREEVAGKNRVLNALVVDRPLPDSLDLITALVEQQVSGSRCCVLVLNRQQRLLSCVGQAGFASAYRQYIGDTPCQYGATSAGTAAYTNKQVLCNDPLADASWQLQRAGLNQLGVAAVWAVPFVDSSGGVCGVLSLCFGSAFEPSEQQAEDLGTILHLCSLAVERDYQQARLARILSSEKFIREIGAQIHGLSTEHYADELKAILAQACRYLDISSMALWSSQGPNKAALQLLCETEEIPAFTEAIPLAGVDALMDEAGSRYLYPGQSEHYQKLCLDNLDWPLFLMAISANGSSLDGLLVVSAGIDRLPSDIESYLEIISDMLANALGKIWLMEALSKKAASDRTEKEKLEGELDVAKDIQAAMIPGGGRYGRSIQGWCIRARLRPARAVGGDFFSDITLPDGRVFVAVGDVSDKGVPAALFMSKVVTILNFLTKDKVDLSSLMGRLNNELAIENDSCMFATLVGVVLDTRNGQIEYCSAGHCAPLLVRQGMSPVFLTDENGPPVGLYEDAEFPSHRMSLPAQASLVLYSDGVTEALNQSGEVFGEDRLAELANLTFGHQKNLVESIDTMVRAYAGESPQSDDLTIMVVNRS
ncbi:GAF domain-containing SpoIIE family protein phosphatase [Marinobacter sp. SS21]|uniref:GAF domain-containing SpoIIE family protein phosphatase n=1 Tax=Marinobacter sp. SS21 TaxID=2979460 RepID=UPI00232FA7F5|nr:GAF domain-containing SpoIIE family protein phosphatase [Marinobacter sp. SS21]MDC0662089.1 SpoIIE family protein phosphatase [Marinobacter sp. SS21]